MSELTKETPAEVQSGATQQTKKVRRGITNEVRATARKKFNERDANPNGLFIAHVDSIEVKSVKIGEETIGLPSFNGLDIPVLQITYASNQQNESERRYVTQRFMPAESNVETIPNGKSAWKVDSVFAYIKHLMDVFVLKGRDMTEEEEDALTLPFTDFDENMEYVPVEPEEVIAGWTQLFNNFAAIMNGTNKDGGTPVYKQANGKPLAIWLKMLRFIKANNTWKPVVNTKNGAGELALPTFVGEGVIELFVPNKMPVLSLNPARETIVYREIAKTPNTPAGPSAPIAGGVPVTGVPGANMGDEIGIGEFGMPQDNPF